MPEIRYNIATSKLPATVELRSGETVVQTNQHATAGDYTFVDVQPGAYLLHLADANGCTSTAEVLVPEPPPALTVGLSGSDFSETDYDLGTSYVFNFNRATPAEGIAINTSKGLNDMGGLGIVNVPGNVLEYKVGPVYYPRKNADYWAGVVIEPGAGYIVGGSNEVKNPVLKVAGIKP